MINHHLVAVLIFENDIFRVVFSQFPGKVAKVDDVLSVYRVDNPVPPVVIAQIYVRSEYLQRDDQFPSLRIRLLMACLKWTHRRCSAPVIAPAFDQVHVQRHEYDATVDEVLGYFIELLAADEAEAFSALHRL